MESIPELPLPKSRTEQFSKEVDERLDRVVSSLKSAMNRVDALGLSKAKAKELKDELSRALTNLTANLDFVAESFDEHAEKTVEKAKAEVHGYMTGVLMRAGVQAIGEQMPLAITARPATEEEIANVAD